MRLAGKVALIGGGENGMIVVELVLDDHAIFSSSVLHLFPCRFSITHCTLVSAKDVTAAVDTRLKVNKSKALQSGSGGP